MSNIVYITELVKLEHQDDVLAAQEKGFAVTPVYGGFAVYANQYAFGNWVCKLSNGDLLVQSDDTLQSMALSTQALINAGLVSIAPPVSDAMAKLVDAFIDGQPFIYVQADRDHDDDTAEIKVIQRAPKRDELTSTIDTEQTWVIVASQYASGRHVDGVRLSAFIDQLKQSRIDFKLGARGIETV